RSSERAPDSSVPSEKWRYASAFDQPANVSQSPRCNKYQCVQLCSICSGDSDRSSSSAITSQHVNASSTSGHHSRYAPSNAWVNAMNSADLICTDDVKYSSAVSFNCFIFMYRLTFRRLISQMASDKRATQSICP